jgi:hypothetical protein
VPVAGVVVNRYPAEVSDPAAETNPRAIERWGKVSVLCLAPDEMVNAPKLPDGIVGAIDNVDWARLTQIDE